MGGPPSMLPFQRGPETATGGRSERVRVAAPGLIWAMAFQKMMLCLAVPAQGMGMVQPLP